MDPKTPAQLISIRNKETASIRRIANGFTVKTDQLYYFVTLDAVFDHVRKFYA